MKNLFEFKQAAELPDYEPDDPSEYDADCKAEAAHYEHVRAIWNANNSKCPACGNAISLDDALDNYCFYCIGIINAQMWAEEQP